MSPALGLPPPRSAAAAGLFRPGGDGYSLLPDPIFDRLSDLLPKELRKLIMNAVPHVLRFFVKLAQAGALDELVTDRAIAAATGVSERTVQYVLWALDVVMGGAGMPIIDRMRSQGRRIISFVRGFVPSGMKPATFAPPVPPLNTPETTTTREPSSSSIEIGGKAGQGREVAPPELVDRACRLIPEATPGKVADAVALYSADWVERALDLVAKRNGKPGNRPVESWGFVLRILDNWRRLDGPPPRKPAAPPAPTRAKEGPAKVEPPTRLTAEEVAELVERCRSRNPAQARFARVQLAKALAEGGIPPELAATVPAELVDAPRPRAP